MKLVAFLVILCIGFCCTIFSIGFGKIHHTLDYDNEKHMVRGIVTILVGCVSSLGFIFLPVTVWPLPVIALLTTLFTNQVTGIIASAMFSMISVVASGQSVFVFFLYFCACLVTVLVFYGIDESVKLIAPFCIHIFAMMVIETAFVCLSQGSLVQISDFIMPSVNLMLCIILEYIVLKIFCSLVIFRDRERYLIINDTEYPLLKECREKNKEAYMHAVHTAYLSEKIADALQIQSPMIKTAAYYYQIGNGLLENVKPDVEYYKYICEEHEFPKEATALLLDCVSHKNHYVTREEAIVCMADCMITELMKLFKKDATVSPDYPEMICQLFHKKEEEHAFDDCMITKKELNTIKKTLLKETLYYDFLR